MLHARCGLGQARLAKLAGGDRSKLIAREAAPISPFITLQEFLNVFGEKLELTAYTCRLDSTCIRVVNAWRWIILKNSEILKSLRSRVMALSPT